MATLGFDKLSVLGAHSAATTRTVDFDAESNDPNRLEFDGDRDPNRILVEHFANERTLRGHLFRFLIKDPKWSRRAFAVRVLVKVLSCILYIVVRARDDNERSSDICQNTTALVKPCEFWCPPDSASGCSTWYNLLWVHREHFMWILQLLVGIWCLLETTLHLYVASGVTGWRLYRNVNRFHVLDFLTGLPFVLGVFYERARNLFIPVFVNCWSAKHVLTLLLSDVYRVLRQEESQVSHKSFVLLSSVICILFTSVCSIHHLQRLNEPWDLFLSLWFVIVTITTVGYGDISPSRWPGQLYVIVMIGLSLYIIPKQLEELTSILKSQRKFGGSLNKESRHIVVIGQPKALNLHDLLNEIYAYRQLQNVIVVVLSPEEPDKEVLLLLSVPLYRNRVIYLYGSALKENDLARANLDKAEACFILGNRRTTNLVEEDQRTILRAWAVRDYAPHVRMFVHLFNRRNKLHVNFAEHILCEGELSNALLAISCLCPGASTLFTLLVHTSREKKGAVSQPWHKDYGQSSATEIYHILVKESTLFGPYVGKNFLFTSAWVYRKSGILMIGVRRAGASEVMLNPGRSYILQGNDTILYLAISREENTLLSVPLPKVRPALRSSLAVMAAVALRVTQAGEPIKMETAKDQKQFRRQVERLDIAAQRAYSQGVAEGMDFSPLQNAQSEIDMSAIRSLSRVASTRQTAEDYEEPPDLPVQENFDHPPDRDFHGLDALRVIAATRAQSHSRFKHLRNLSRHLSHDTRSTSTAKDTSVACNSSLSSFAKKRRGAITPDDFATHLAPPTCLDDLPAEETAELSDEEKDELQRLEDGQAADTDDTSSYEMTESLVRREGRPWVMPEQYVIGEPRYMPFVQGKVRLKCHLLPEDQPLCCMELHRDCEHSPRSHAQSLISNHLVNAVIIGCESSDKGLFSTVATLRAHYLPRECIKPIVLLLGQRPDTTFLRMMSCFPKVMFMVGAYAKVDDLLLAGVLLAETVLIIGSRRDADETYMVDAHTLVGVQKLYRFFPNTNIITQLAHRSNMRFLSSRAPLHRYQPCLQLQKIEAPLARAKTIQLSPDHLNYMFRPQFAAGRVFTSSMLDTLLYQTFTKPYLIDVVRQLVGCKQNEKCQSHLAMVPVTKEMMRKTTYGRLLQHLAFKTGDLAIGLYRTLPPTENEIIAAQLTSMHDAERIVNARLASLGIDGAAPEFKPRGQSFVLINPRPKLYLLPGDILYVIRPPKEIALPASPPPSPHTTKHPPFLRGGGSWYTRMSFEADSPEHQRRHTYSGANLHSTATRRSNRSNRSQSQDAYHSDLEFSSLREVSPPSPDEDGSHVLTRRESCV